MNCDECQKSLLEFSLGQLDDECMNEVRDHIREGCHVCVKELTEIADAWASLATNLEPVKPSPDVESKLLAMIRGEIAPPVESRQLSELIATDSARRFRVRSYALAASLLGIAAGLVAWNFTFLGGSLSRVDQFDPPGSNWGELRPSDPRTGFQTVLFEPHAETKGLRLTAVVNHLNKEWYIVGTGLPVKKKGDVLRVWFETKSGKFRGFTLPVNGSGKGGLAISMSSEEQADLASLWLTVESQAETDRPSDDVLFQASVK